MGGKVYVIDDDPAMRDSLDFLLGSAGFSVAVRICADFSERASEAGDRLRGHGYQDAGHGWHGVAPTESNRRPPQASGHRHDRTWRRSPSR